MRGDPYWLKAPFVSKCVRCGREIRKGAQAFYFPRSSSIYCDGEDCGKQESRTFEAARFDEEYGL